MLVESRRQEALGGGVCRCCDLGLSFWLVIALPVQWAVDLVTALLLFLLLGRKWVILPGLIAEAIPGLNIFPFWLLVVGSIATWGAISAPAVALQWTWQSCCEMSAFGGKADMTFCTAHVRL